MLGPLDPEALIAIVGFDVGGPLSFCTFSRAAPARFMTYVSCELAVRSEQRPSSVGRYELLVTCNDERWVRSVVSDIGRMSMEVAFDHGHTLDIGAWVDSAATIQGIVFETLYKTLIEHRPYGILRIIGITRSELEHAERSGADELLRRLRDAEVHPRTDLHRTGIV
jgi:hypothetical protein